MLTAEYSENIVSPTKHYYEYEECYERFSLPPSSFIFVNLSSCSEVSKAFQVTNKIFFWDEAMSTNLTVCSRRVLPTKGPGIKKACALCSHPELVVQAARLANLQRH